MSISQKFLSLRKAIASVASVAVFTMAVIVAPQASAQTFNDVPTSHWSYDYVEQLVTDGVIDANDTYRPDASLNRAELVKIAIEATTGIQTDLIPSTPTFDDVPTDAWFFQYVETAAALGVVEGYKDASGNMTGLFGPGDTVNRAAATKILVNAYGVPTDTNPAGIFSDVDEDAWYYDFVTTAFNQSIIDGYKDADCDLTGKFGPGDPVTRAQVAKLAVKATDPVEREEDTTTDPEEEVCEGDLEYNEETEECEEVDDTTTTPTADGDLEVSVSADSMESATIPRSANVAVASYDLTAGADDIKVTALKVIRGGVGSRTSIDSLVLKDGEGNRISKSKTINSDDEVTFTLLSGGVEIEAGETLTATIVIATDAAGTGNHHFSLVDADAVSSNAQDVVADFPVVSNTFEIGSAAAGSLDMTNDGTPATVKVGETDATIAKFKLENGNVEDVKVTQITLKETGTAGEDDALANIKLLAAGEEVATGTLNDKYIAFVFDEPLEILKNKNVKFKVTADIIGEAAKVLNIDLDSTVDIEGKGDNFGFGIGVTDNFIAKDVSIDAGAITITKTEPVDKIRMDKKDVVLATVDITINSGEQVELKAFNALLTTSASGVLALFENVELHDVTSGSVYDLSADSIVTTDTTVTYYDRDLGISLGAGDTRSFEIRADSKNVTFTGQSVTVSFSGVGDDTTADGIDFQEIVDDEYVTDVIPSSLSFKTINGENSSATVSILTQSSAKNAVIGTEGIEIIEFQIKAGSASSINLTELAVKGTNGSGTAVNQTFVNAAHLYQKDGSTLTQIDQQSGSQFAGNTVTFDSLDVDVDADQTTRFVVAIDIVDDENQAFQTLNFELSSLTLDDDDSDPISTITVDGTEKTATAITGAASARTVTIVGVGTLVVTVDNTDSKTDKAKLVLGNTTSDYVASFELNATNEPILVKDLTVTGTGSNAAVSDANFKSAVSDIILYDEDDNEIARESVTARITTFDNIDYVVAEGSENVYVKVKAAKMGKDAAGSIVEDMVFSMAITDADGDSSNKAITLPSASSSSLAFSTVPTRISGAEFVTSCGNKSVATTLVNAENNVAILKLTTDASSNSKTADGSSLKTNLTKLAFTVVSTNANGSINTGALITDASNSGSIVVEKINGSGADEIAELTSMNAGLATVDLTSFSAVNAEIDNSTSVCYLIKASLDGMSASGQGNIQIKMTSLDTGSGTTANVTYDSDDTTGIESGKNDRDALLLDDSTLETKVISSNE